MIKGLRLEAAVSCVSPSLLQSGYLVSSDYSNCRRVFFAFPKCHVPQNIVYSLLLVGSNSTLNMLSRASLAVLHSDLQLSSCTYGMHCGVSCTSTRGWDSTAVLFTSKRGCRVDVACLSCHKTTVNNKKLRRTHENTPDHWKQTLSS